MDRTRCCDRCETAHTSLKHDYYNHEKCIQKFHLRRNLSQTRSSETKLKTFSPVTSRLRALPINQFLISQNIFLNLRREFNFLTNRIESVKKEIITYFYIFCFENSRCLFFQRIHKHFISAVLEQLFHLYNRPRTV